MGRWRYAVERYSTHPCRLEGRPGQVRGLAVTSATRMAEFPDIPTSAEIGVPNWIVSTWYGLWAIKGTPQPIVERMYLEVAKALRVEKMQAIWKDKAAEAGGETTMDEHDLFSLKGVGAGRRSGPPRSQNGTSSSP